MHAAYDTPGWAITMITTAVILATALFFKLFGEKRAAAAAAKAASTDEITAATAATDAEAAADAAAQEPFSVGAFLRDSKTAFAEEWRLWSPKALNRNRVVEVVGLALISGFIFFEVGARTTHRALRESISLLFFSVTLVCNALELRVVVVVAFLVAVAVADVCSCDIITMLPVMCNTRFLLSCFNLSTSSLTRLALLSLSLLAVDAHSHVRCCRRLRRLSAAHAVRQGRQAQRTVVLPSHHFGVCARLRRLRL
jgi:hypothetical protein